MGGPSIGHYLAGFMGVAVLLFFYLLPSVIAWGRGAKRAWGIFVINFFLGWTLVGWVGALAWAVSDAKHSNDSKSERP